MTKIQFATGVYRDSIHEGHEVEVTEEGCIFCGHIGGWKLLCDYPYIGEFCDDCPLRK